MIYRNKGLNGELIVCKTVEKDFQIEFPGCLRNGIAFLIGKAILGIQISDEKFAVPNHEFDFYAHRGLILMLCSHKRTWGIP
jgi:hypothetical protein